MSELALYETAKEALATAVRVDEVIDIHDQARRAQAYAKIARDRRLVADAQELIARAERKLGIMLRRVKEQGLLSSGGRPSNSNVDEPETGADAEPVFDSTSFTLAELGISKKLSSRAQALAELGDDDFEDNVAHAREKTLAADAAVVSPKRVRVGAAPKLPKPAALEPRRFHQFAFSVLALSVSSDRVGSRAIQFLARECGMLAVDEDDLDFTPEAAVAMGSIAAVALRAIDGENQSQAKAADDATSGSAMSEPLAGAGGPQEAEAASRVDGDRAPSATSENMDATAGETAPFRYSKHTAESMLRARYEHEPADALAAELGVPVNTVRTWAFRLGLTSKQRISAMATERNSRRVEP